MDLKLEHKLPWVKRHSIEGLFDGLGDTGELARFLYVKLTKLVQQDAARSWLGITGVVVSFSDAQQGFSVELVVTPHCCFPEGYNGDTSVKGTVFFTVAYAEDSLGSITSREDLDRWVGSIYNKVKFNLFAVLEDPHSRASEAISPNGLDTGDRVY